MEKKYKIITSVSLNEDSSINFLDLYKLYKATNLNISFSSEDKCEITNIYFSLTSVINVINDINNYFTRTNVKALTRYEEISNDEYTVKVELDGNSFELDIVEDMGSVKYDSYDDILKVTCYNLQTARNIKDNIDLSESCIIIED